MIQLYNADCLQKLKDLSSNSVDLILCDLPYGCLTGGGGKEKAKRKETGESVIAGCSWDVPIDLEPFWKEIKRVRKSDDSPTLHFCTAKFGYDLIKSNEKEFRYDLVWAKPNAVGFLAANKMPMRSHENIYIFSKAGAYYNRVDLSVDFPAGGGGRSAANFLPISNIPNTGTTEKGKRCVKSWIYCSNKKTKGGHPTAKPIELYKFLIERYCPAGGTVLDPTFGSGNSGRAAKELGRKYIGIEKDKVFYEKAVKEIMIEETKPPEEPQGDYIITFD